MNSSKIIGNPGVFGIAATVIVIFILIAVIAGSTISVNKAHGGDLGDSRACEIYDDGSELCQGFNPLQVFKNNKVVQRWNIAVDYTSQTDQVVLPSLVYTVNRITPNGIQKAVDGIVSLSDVSVSSGVKKRVIDISILSVAIEQGVVGQYGRNNVNGTYELVIRYTLVSTISKVLSSGQSTFGFTVNAPVSTRIEQSGRVILTERPPNGFLTVSKLPVELNGLVLNSISLSNGDQTLTTRVVWKGLGSTFFGSISSYPYLLVVPIYLYGGGIENLDFASVLSPSNNEQTVSYSGARPITHVEIEAINKVPTSKNDPDVRGGYYFYVITREQIKVLSGA